MSVLTVANAAAFVNKTAFNPIVTGILYLLRNYLLDHNKTSSSFLSNILTNEHTGSTLYWLALFGVVKYFNSWLNYFALNNYTNLTEQFIPSKETALVTGGASGIGALTVQGLARAGLKKVIVWDIQELTYTPPPNVVFYKVDLTSGSEIDAAAERVRSEIGHVTIVINNAGTGIGKTILGSTERTVKLTFNVNAVAPFLVTKAFLPHMIKTNHGHVLTIASLASFTTPAQMVDYCASKAAALVFSEGLSQELKHRYGAPGIRNSVVHPMWVKTPLTQVFNSLNHILANQLEPEDVANAVIKQVLLGKSAQICIPSSLGFSALIRALPNWIQERIRDEQQDMIVVNKDF
ncbi:uncharacterized protein SAPINGB_P002129 [Magnusiomyces paraingens]|uniref:Short-chain dehydrogenase/reductase 3 n=1 Tax=Magnusiomyces paraingens TaxID=2606893 RepID=A0A5E8BCW6_9ASCO|nr:uncharacterized protein SAPINGB_P002129 [Saprochaete ingens]VVT49153.1 unnamed protein product [Saprochaete ingens]